MERSRTNLLNRNSRTYLNLPDVEKRPRFVEKKSCMLQINLVKYEASDGPIGTAIKPSRFAVASENLLNYKSSTQSTWFLSTVAGR